MDQLKALEIEPRRFGLVVKDPRSLKRVDFIAVTGLGFWNKIDGEGEALQSVFTFNVGRVVVVWVGRSSCVASLRVVSLSVASSSSVTELSYPYSDFHQKDLWQWKMIGRPKLNESVTIANDCACMEPFR